MKGRAVRLAGVLDQAQPVAAGDVGESLEVGDAAVQMHRENGAGARGDRAFRRRRIQQQRPLIDIGEHRDGARPQDGLCGEGRGERRGDDFVARADAGRAQRDFQRLGAVADPDGEARAAERRPFPLERFQLGIEHVARPVQHPRHGRLQFPAAAGGLPAEIQERHLHR